MTPDGGHRTAEKAKIICPPPSGVDIISNNKNDGLIYLLIKAFLTTYLIQSKTENRLSINLIKVVELEPQITQFIHIIMLLT